MILTILTFLRTNKELMKIISIFLILLSLFLLYKRELNNSFNSGYNEAVKITNKELDEKYKKAIEVIKQENIDRALIENKELVKNKGLIKVLEDKNKSIQRELNDVLRNSKSNLINQECSMSNEELELINKGIL